MFNDTTSSAWLSHQMNLHYNRPVTRWYCIKRGDVFTQEMDSMHLSIYTKCIELDPSFMQLLRSSVYTNSLKTIICCREFALSILILNQYVSINAGYSKVIERSSRWRCSRIGRYQLVGRPASNCPSSSLPLSIQ